MKAKIWMERETGMWLFAIPGVPFSYDCSAVTWEEALAAVLQELDADRAARA